MPQSKKIVLATFGTLGDIYPFVAIARALEAKGLEPTIVCPGTYADTIAAEGLRFVPLRPDTGDITGALGVDFDGVFRLMLKNPHFILDEIYMRFLRETYEDIVAASEGAALIMSHSLLVGASQAAEALGLPSARVALAPLHLQSAFSPSLTPGAPYWPQPKNIGARTYNRIVRSTVRGVTNSRMGKLRAFRAEVGLPRSSEDVFLDFGRANGAAAVFGLYSPLFAPPHADGPRNLILPGFPFYAPRDPARARLDPALDAFLDAGEPPIVFTLGTFAPELDGDFYDVSLRAARALGRRAVLLAGRQAERLRPLAGLGEHVCAGAPHSLLFSRSLCVVHHGGIGTTAETLRAGKPQVIVPFFGDQPDHGARIKRLGVGAMLALSAYDEARATAALRDVLSGACCENARRFAAALTEERGVNAVADWTETMLARKPLEVPSSRGTERPTNDGRLDARRPRWRPCFLSNRV